MQENFDNQLASSDPSLFNRLFNYVATVKNSQFQKETTSSNENQNQTDKKMRSPGSKKSL